MVRGPDLISQVMSEEVVSRLLSLRIDELISDSLVIVCSEPARRLLCVLVKIDSPELRAECSRSLSRAIRAGCGCG